MQLAKLSIRVLVEEFLELWTTLRRFPKPVWIIFAGMFINRFGTFVVPFLALHMTRLGFSVAQAGIAVGTYGAGNLFATLLGGHLADTIGRKNTIIASLFSGAATIMLLSQAESFQEFLLFGFLAGFAADTYRPASSALLADLVPEKDRVTGYATLRFAINSGWAFGPATAGFLAQYSYFWLFVVDAATSCCFGVLAWWGLPQLKQNARASFKHVFNAFGSIREAVVVGSRDSRFVQTLMASAASALVFMQIFSTFGMEVKSAGIDERVYGILLGLNGVLIVLFEIPLTALTRRLAPRPVMAVGYGLMGTGMLAMAFAEAVPGYTLAVSLFTFGEMTAMPVMMAYVASLAAPELRGRYMGVYGLTWAFAIMAGPSLGMALFAWSSFGLWILCACLALVAAWIILR